ncbi:hypothetical protein RHOER0001_4361 [Rhodococcus erythropolis SK121]|nr:hypothetical protein RHOER0001_4361 [Rhodococcus erythropolis SK121]
MAARFATRSWWPVWVRLSDRGTTRRKITGCPVIHRIVLSGSRIQTAASV